MKLLNKNALFTIMTIAVLILHLVFPIAAFADGETPATPTDTAVATTTPEPTNTTVAVTDSPTPDPVTSTPEPPVTDTSTPTPDASSSPTPDPVDSATPALEDTSTPTPTSSDPSATDSSPTETTAPPDPTVTTDQTPLLETVQAISDTTNVVLLDENGQPVPLASQDAAKIVATGDPVWCPTGLPPLPGFFGCSFSYNNLSDLVNLFVPPTNGTIWIQSGNDSSGSAVTIDGSGTWNSASSYSLTLQGGWSGIFGDPTIGSNSIFSFPLTITNWNNSIAIQNITAPSVNVSNVTSFGGGISVSNVTGDVNLTNTNEYYGNGISVSNVKGDVNLNSSQAYNGSGIGITGVSGNVNLTNVTANSNWNGWYGIYVQNQGDVLLDSINANDNYFYGVLVDSTGNVTMTGTNNASYNGEGIAVFSNKMVDLRNITADGNWYGGVYVYQADGGINLDNINASYNNYGVSAVSSGHVGLSNINVNGNWWDGIGVIADSATLKNIFSDGNLYDYWQSYYGIALSTYTSGGSINLDNVNVHNNCNGISVLNNLNTLNITNSDISFNTFGIQLSTPDTKINKDPGSNVSNNLADYTIGGECWTGTPGIPFLPIVVIDIGSGGTFDLDCNSQSSFAVLLPNGDRVTIVCPVSGRARIFRLDNTSLPVDLPEGFTYASAFSLEILQGPKSDTPIPVIKEGGYIKASFDASSLQPGATYSILYLDHGTTWIQLKDFMVDEKGNPRIFELKPGDPDNQDRKILSGVKFDTSKGSPRVEVSTNFPGVFALVQH